MTDPTLTVTVTNYNYARYLRHNVESILKQTYDNFELIIIDNASTDESADLISDLAREDARVRPIVHACNQGMLFSYREAAATSRGKYRVHVEADDWVIDPGAFEQQVTMLETHPAVTFCYTALAMIGPRGEVLFLGHARGGILPGADAVERVLRLNVGHSGMMIRQDSFRVTPGYEEGFPYTVDTRLAIRLCEIGDVGYIDEPLYAFRQHDSNLHSRDESGLLRGEYLPLIDAAFEGPLGSRMTRPRAARRRVEQNALIHLPRQYIFSGQPRNGWNLYWQSVRLRPFRTVAQRGTIDLLARTALGRHNYARLRARLRPHQSMPPSMEAAGFPD